MGNKRLLIRTIMKITDRIPCKKDDLVGIVSNIFEEDPEKISTLIDRMEKEALIYQIPEGHYKNNIYNY